MASQAFSPFFGFFSIVSLSAFTPTYKALRGRDVGIGLFKASLAIALAAMLGACASTPKDDGIHTGPKDSFEGFNRQVYKFNHTLDRFLLKPVAKGYDKVAPQPVKTGVGNFFDNLGEVKNVLNDMLQWKWKQAGNDSARFMINSTVGVLGLFDVAARTGLEKSDGEDFGQTLAVWGVPQGPYIEVPLLGPNTVRTLVAWPVDWVASPENHLEDDDVQWGLNALDIVHTRAGLLKAEAIASGDRYLFIRDAYLQRRDFLIKDGKVEDDFGGDLDFDSFDDEDF